MQAKYPEADFGEYFRFLVSCAGTEKALTEEHHIAPRKQFPELVRASENLITLTVDDHAQAHRLLGAAHSDFSRANAAWIAARKTLSFITARNTAGREHMNKLNADPVFVAARIKRFDKMRSDFPHANVKGAQMLNADPVFAAANAERMRMRHTDPVFSEKNVTRGKMSTHTRWHVNRGIVSPICSICSF